VIFSFELLGRRIPAQVGMGMGLHMCRLNYGEDLKLKAVNFVHAEPSSAEEYLALFSASVQFSAKRDRLTLSYADVDKYLIGANPQLVD